MRVYQIIAGSIVGMQCARKEGYFILGGRGHPAIQVVGMEVVSTPKCTYAQRK